MESPANHKYLAFAGKAEAVHAKLCAMALAAVTQDRDLVEIRLFLCPVCGHVEPGQPPATCPTCGVLHHEFVRV
jgi:rubrerythrin